MTGQDVSHYVSSCLRLTSPGRSAPEQRRCVFLTGTFKKSLFPRSGRWYPTCESWLAGGATVVLVLAQLCCSGWLCTLLELPISHWTHSPSQLRLHKGHNQSSNQRLCQCLLSVQWRVLTGCLVETLISMQLSVKPSTAVLMEDCVTMEKQVRNKWPGSEVIFNNKKVFFYV